jgi:hypothetical protein
LNAISVGLPWYALVRTVARTSAWNMRPMRSSSSDGTASSAASTSRVGHRHPGDPVTVTEVGVEPCFEQLDHETCQEREAGERVLDVTLAEGEPDLVGVLGVAPQHVRLRSGQPGVQHELVEAVGLDRAGEQPFEGRPQLTVAVLVDLDAGGHAHPDVVDEALLPLDHEPVRVLVDRVEPEVPEHRQQVGERDLVAASIHAEPPLVRTGVGELEHGGAHVATAVRELDHARQVERCRRREVELVVAGRQHRREPVERRTGALLVELGPRGREPFVGDLSDGGVERHSRCLSSRCDAVVARPGPPVCHLVATRVRCLQS